MAGIQNNILFSEGIKISPTSGASLTQMLQSATDVCMINHTGDPEGVVTANTGTLSLDPTTSKLYKKGTGGGNTGWSEVPAQVFGSTGTVYIGNGAGVPPSFSDTPLVTSISITDAPVAGTDGANKAYVDLISSGFTFKTAAHAASTTTLTVTYNNGAAGVGATLTNAGAQAAFAIDGYTAVATDRILIKDQSTTFQNGVYEVTDIGSGATNWVLTRTTDYDTPAEISIGSTVPVINGTDNANTFWVEVNSVTTIGTDPIQFNLFGASAIMTTQYATLVGGATNNIVSVGPSATAGQVFQSGGNAANPSYSTATYPSVATGTGTLLRADGTNWSATTSTYPNTNAINTLLYASSANVMAALATANNGLLVTSATGVPSILSGPGTTGNMLQANAAAAPSFSTATYPSVATGTGTLLRADGTNWSATTSTYPDTNTINTLLYASSANVMAALATANNGVLVTSATGVPSILAGPGVTGRVLVSNAAAPPSFSASTFPATAGPVGTIMRSDGTDWVATTSTYPNTNAINTLLYASAADTMSALATANNGLLVTSATGVPSILAGPGVTGRVLVSNAAAPPSFSASTFPATAGAVGTIMRSDGTDWVASTSTYPNTNAINTLLYASSADTMAALATANNGLLVTSATGVPSILAGPGTTGNVLQANAAAAPSFSTATYPSVATGTGTLLRADGTNWSATTSTYPNTNAINTLLYASSANVMAALATANNGVLVTSATGVPSILAGPGTTGNVLQANAGSAPSYSTATYPSAATGTGKMLRADGTNWTPTTATFPDTAGTANNVLTSDGTNWVSSPPTGGTGGLTWAVITADQTAAVNHGYFCNKAGTLVLTMPSISAVGDIVAAFNINTAAGTQIKSANPGQLIFGDVSMTANTGTITSIKTGDVIFLICAVANTTWYCYSPGGNWTTV